MLIYVLCPTVCMYAHVLHVPLVRNPIPTLHATYCILCSCKLCVAIVSVPTDTVWTSYHDSSSVYPHVTVLLGLFTNVYSVCVLHQEFQNLN